MRSSLGCSSIAGVPPFNGYVSLGLIHDACDTDPAAYARDRRADRHSRGAARAPPIWPSFAAAANAPDDLERLHPGWLPVSPSGAGASPSAFLAYPVLHHIAEPAAGAFDPAAYAHGVLSTGTASRSR